MILAHTLCNEAPFYAVRARCVRVVDPPGSDNEKACCEVMQWLKVHRVQSQRCSQRGGQGHLPCVVLPSTAWRSLMLRSLVGSYNILRWQIPPCTGLFRDVRSFQLSACYMGVHSEGGMASNHRGNNAMQLRMLILVRAQARGCKFLNTDLSESDISGADWSGAEVTGSVFVGANLMNMMLVNSKLTDTSFTGAVIEGTDFTGAVDVGTASFLGATGTPIQLDHPTLGRGTVPG
eukprot:4017909-Pleurochrysis_carterae.AAC.1